MRPAILAPLLAASVTGGCASTPAVRSLAQQNGAYVQSLSSGTESFIASANELNAQGEARLQRLAADAASLSADAREQRFAWDDSGDQVRARTFERISAISSEDIVDGMKPVVTTPAAIAPVKGGYGASIKALAQLSAKPKAVASLKELLTFGSSVRSAYNDLQDKAQKADSAAGASSKNQDTKQAASAVQTLKQAAPQS